MRQTATVSDVTPSAFKTASWYSRQATNRYLALSGEWTDLCEEHLPIMTSDIWRLSRERSRKDPSQGWKLHVAATVLNACDVLRKVAPVLNNRGALYKAPRSLDELAKLNAGIYYGYSQVGKFLTIYPQSTDQALQLASELHMRTLGLQNPTVPFDLRYRPASCVYYRYGGFVGLAFDREYRESGNLIRDPNGNLVPDRRDLPEAKPKWVSDPFLAATRHERLEPLTSPLKTRFRAFRALAQRGKGGVYQALDVGTAPPRLCVVKEGRKDGEVDWQGRDGLWRVRYESRILRELKRAGIDCPVFYSSFTAEGNFYLVTEFIEGEDLEKWLCRKKRRLPVKHALRLGIEIAGLICRMHAAGWVWRDCKPRNILRTANGTLRPIDFEGACKVHQPDPLPFGTSSYAPPEADMQFYGQSRLPEDLYALGVTLHILLYGKPPQNSRLSEPSQRRVPVDTRELINNLLNPDPALRPEATRVVARLQGSLANLIEAGYCTRLTRRAKSVKRPSPRKSS